MPKDNNNDLTIKQEKFCNKQIECGNASEAYRYAYDAFKMKDTTVNRCAKEMMDNPNISARINELREELKGKTDITKERILKELNAILEAKITDYVEFKGQSLRFKDLDTLTEAQQRAIESIEETKFGIRLKLHGKSWTIERICKMLGYDAPMKQELNLGEDTAKLITGMQVN